MAASVTTQVGVGDSASVTNTLETASFTPTGTDKVLYALVGCGATSPGSPDQCKYASTGGTGGESFTLLDSVRTVNVNIKLSVWKLVAPSAGSGTVWAHYAANNDERWIICVAVQNAAGTEGTIAYASGLSSAPSVNATSTSGELVLDFLSTLDGGGNSRLITVGTNQTSVKELEGGTPSTGGPNNISIYEDAGVSRETASGGTTTMAWSVDGGFSLDWGIFAFQVDPVGAVPPVAKIAWIKG